MTDAELTLLIIAGVLALLLVLAAAARWYMREIDGLYDDDGEHL